MNHMMVEQFQRLVLGNQQREQIGLLSPDEMSFTANVIREELTELLEAFDKGDLVGVVDALIDLDFFLKGAVYKHGISKENYDRCFAEVFKCNMEKRLGRKDSRADETVPDAIKPAGWVGPEEGIRAILEEAMDANRS